MPPGPNAEIAMERTYRALVAKRSDRVSEALTQAGLWPADQMRTLFGAWKLDLTRASKIEFLLMCRNGIVTDAATVLGVERTQVRHSDQFGRSSGQREIGADGRVHFTASLEIPQWLERFLGTPVDLPGRNPVAYLNLRVDDVAGTVDIVA
jgi:hypothetical protein